MKPCPLCDRPGIRILMGPLPVWLCQNEECSAVWGFWSRLACWLTPILYPPSDDGEGFAFVAYTGSYWKALWGLMTR